MIEQQKGPSVAAKTNIETNKKMDGQENQLSLRQEEPNKFGKMTGKHTRHESYCRREKTPEGVGTSIYRIKQPYDKDLRVHVVRN